MLVYLTSQIQIYTTARFKSTARYQKHHSASNLSVATENSKEGQQHELKNHGLLRNAIAKLERRHVGHHISEEIRVASRKGCRDFAVLVLLIVLMLFIFAFGVDGDANLAMPRNQERRCAKLSALVLPRLRIV